MRSRRRELASLALLICVSVGCNHQAEPDCIMPPCPMPMAITASVTSASGGPVPGLTPTLSGATSGSGQCTAGQTTTECVVPGMPGTYNLQFDGSRVSGEDAQRRGSRQHTTVRMHFRAGAASDRHSHAKVNSEEQKRGRDGEAAEQADEADEAFGGIVASMDMPPHARAGGAGRGHRFAAYPRCSADAANARRAGVRGGGASSVPVAAVRRGARSRYAGRTWRGPSGHLQVGLADPTRATPWQCWASSCRTGPEPYRTCVARPRPSPRHDSGESASYLRHSLQDSSCTSGGGMGEAVAGR